MQLSFEIADFTQGQFGPSVLLLLVSVCVCLCVYQPQACLCDNLWPIQARITKFGPEMQNTLVKIHIVFGVDWYWSSWLYLT